MKTKRSFFLIFFLFLPLSLSFTSSRDYVVFWVKRSHIRKPLSRSCFLVIHRDQLTIPHYVIDAILMTSFICQIMNVHRK